MENNNNVKEIKALINLIDDPDGNVFEEIKKKIYNYGEEILPYLETAWENTLEPVTQRRIEDIVHNIQFENVKAELKLWVEQDEKDLLTGWLIITRYHFPELKEENIKLELNRIKKDIWLELNDDLTALERIKVFNHVFYDVCGFTGSTEDYHKPQNYLINSVLESKKGNSLSLGAIYMLIAQSLDLPVYGINFPEHFILAYTSGQNSFFVFSEKDKYDDGVLFYINAFSKGSAISRQEAEWFLKQLNLEADPKYFSFCSKLDIITRILNSLISAYERNNEFQKAKEAKKLFNVIVG